jgi:hypothetical protein
MPGPDAERVQDVSVDLIDVLNPRERKQKVIPTGNYFWIGTGGLLQATSAQAIAANAQVSLSATDGKLDDLAITGKFLNAFHNSSAAVAAADAAITIYCPGELFYGASN